MKVRLKEDPREWRKNVLLTALALAVLSSLLRWRRILPATVWIPLLLIFAGLALGASLRPAWFRGYYRASTRFGFWLSHILAQIILAVMFVLLLVPLGLILRLLGKDPLRLKRSPQATSYWHTAKPSGPLDRLF